MKKLNRFCIVFLSVVVFSVSFIIPANAGVYSDYVESIIEMAQDRYYKDLSEKELIEGALRGIFSQMDDYTTFYTTDEANSFFSSMEGNYQGIGVEIMETADGVLVTRVFDGSPAQSAGILPDDIIVKIDGQDIKGISVQEAASLIKGAKGSFVQIGIRRGSSSEIIYFKVERNTVNLSPVKWKIYDDIMYIKLESFSSNSSDFFDQALNEADKKGIKKLVLDLRDNPGGEVDQAVNIASRLVQEGIITTLDFKSEKSSDIVYRSHLKKPKYVTAVLVNGNSASASEILASALQDSGDGFLVGTKTFGKGVFQNLYPVLTPEAYKRYRAMYGDSMVDGYDWINKYNVRIYQSDIIGWVKITTGHYLTRNGRIIHGIGLMPDFEVEDYQLVEGIDINSINELESSVTVQLNGVGNDVYNAEKILKIKGFDIDSPDNILDARTSNALKKYQAEKGISVTGVLDNATRKCLNIDLNELRIKIDKPFAKAIELLGSLH